MSLKEPEILERLQRMDEYDFEHFVAELWERRGWETEVSSKSGDEGIDIIATRSTPYPEKEVIQAKRYHASNKVGRDEAQQYTGLHLQVENADKSVLVCTSQFRDSALSLANDANLKCVDGHALAEMVTQQNGEDLVRKYSSSAANATPERERSGRNRTSNQENRDSGATRSITLVEQSDDITIELLGYERVNTTFSSPGFSGDPVQIDGVILAFKIFNNDPPEISVEEDYWEFSIEDETGKTYSAASIADDSFNNNWEAYGWGRTMIEPGTSSNVGVAVSLPTGSKISQVSVKQKKGFLKQNTILFDLDFKEREQLGGLSDGIKSAI